MRTVQTGPSLPHMAILGSPKIWKIFFFEIFIKIYQDFFRASIGGAGCVTLPVVVLVAAHRLLGLVLLLLRQLVRRRVLLVVPLPANCRHHRKLPKT